MKSTDLWWNNLMNVFFVLCNFCHEKKAMKQIRTHLSSIVETYSWENMRICPPFFGKTCIPCPIYQLAAGDFIDTIFSNVHLFQNEGMHRKFLKVAIDFPGEHHEILCFPNIFGQTIPSRCAIFRSTRSSLYQHETRNGRYKYHDRGTVPFKWIQLAIFIRNMTFFYSISGPFS